MAKVFNVEQIRLSNFLLTGNSAGELWYNDVRLATGGSAVPTTRSIEVLDGLQFITNPPPHLYNTHLKTDSIRIWF